MCIRPRLNFLTGLSLYHNGPKGWTIQYLLYYIFIIYLLYLCICIQLINSLKQSFIERLGKSSQKLENHITRLFT